MQEDEKKGFCVGFESRIENVTFLCGIHTRPLELELRWNK